MSVHSITENIAVSQAALPASAAGEYLTFRLGDEDYAIGILHVQEIRGYEVPTRLAGAPELVRGVLNLRGVIVPVVDLRTRFGVEPAFDGTTVTVVLNVAGRTVGAVVDAVSDVIEFSREQIQPAPELGSSGAAHITGLGSIRQGDRQRMLILLDIEQLMADTLIGLGQRAAFA